jgi:virginiamycin B lyase
MTAKKRTNATPGGSILTHQRPSAVRLFALVFAVVAALAIVLGATLSAAQAAPVGKLKQFKVPTADIQPRSITNGSDGNLWFTLSDPNANVPSQIGRITPAGVITEFDPACNGCILTDIIQGPGDILYYTSNDPFLGRITTSGQILDPIAMPETDVLAGNLAVHDDEIWFTDFNNDSLWRYDVVSEQFTQFPVPEPSDVVVDEAGIVWFTAPLEPGIGRLDPATGAVTVTPTTLVPRQLTIAADGDIWFTARFTPQGVGRLVPATGEVTEFPLTDVGPEGIAASPDGTVWFTQTTKGNIAQITDSGVITEGKVVKNSEPFGITVAPNGDPWYTMMSANKIATLRLR